MKSTLKNFTTRLRAIRREEAGWTLMEAVTGTALISILALMILGIFISASQSHMQLVDHQMGKNQGSVADKVTEIHDAAVAYRKKNPDAPLLTKAALAAEGDVTIPAGLEWSVAEYRMGAGGKLEYCAIAYPTAPTGDERDEAYTKELPAEYNSVNHLLQGAMSYGCWHDEVNSQGKNVHVPNWNEAPRPQNNAMWYDKTFKWGEGA